MNIQFVQFHQYKTILHIFLKFLFQSKEVIGGRFVPVSCENNCDDTERSPPLVLRPSNTSNLMQTSRKNIGVNSLLKNSHNGGKDLGKEMESNIVPNVSLRDSPLDTSTKNKPNELAKTLRVSSTTPARKNDSEKYCIPNASFPKQGSNFPGELIAKSHTLTKNSTLFSSTSSTVTKGNPTSAVTTPSLKQFGSVNKQKSTVTGSINRLTSFKTPSPISVSSSKQDWSLTTPSPGINNSSLNQGFVMNSAMHRTPPMCECGRRTARKTVQQPGPNVGRLFYCCPVGRGGSGTSRKGCGFFKWASSYKNATYSFFGNRSNVSNSSNVSRSPDLFSPLSSDCSSEQLAMSPLIQPSFNTPSSTSDQALKSKFTVTPATGSTNMSVKQEEEHNNIWNAEIGNINPSDFDISLRQDEEKKAFNNAIDIKSSDFEISLRQDDDKVLNTAIGDINPSNFDISLRQDEEKVLNTAIGDINPSDFDVSLQRDEEKKSFNTAICDTSSSDFDNSLKLDDEKILHGELGDISESDFNTSMNLDQSAWKAEIENVNPSEFDVSLKLDESDWKTDINTSDFDTSLKLDESALKVEIRNTIASDFKNNETMFKDELENINPNDFDSSFY